MSDDEYKFIRHYKKKLSKFEKAIDESIEEIKELKIVSGIYRIRNIINGKIYIGSSINIKGRLGDHLNDLKKNKHGSSHLRRSFNKHGVAAFEFTPIEYVEPTKEKLLEREQCWMDFYQVAKYGYNLHPTAGSPLGVKRTEEMNRKNSESQLGSKHHQYGRSRSKKSVAKQKKTMKGRNSGSNNPNYGKDLSGEKGPNAKTTEKEVIEMRRLSDDGMRSQDIAKKFKVHSHRVWMIVKRITWKHL